MASLKINAQTENFEENSENFRKAMSLLFSKSDVRRHLSELGYANVTEEQLDDFVRDLRRLIRYKVPLAKLEISLARFS